MSDSRKDNLTERLRRLIIQEILNGKYSPGSRLPTERDFATLSGTSRITVRRAYEQLERSGIITRLRGSGTRVSKSFRGNPENIMRIALISTIRETFAVEFIEAAEKAVSKNDALFILALTDDERDESSVAMRLVSEGIKNIIVWGEGARPNADLFEKLRVLGMNIVFFDRVRPGPYADFIGLDNKHAINTIIADAVAEECESFLFFDAAPIDYDSNRERREAFETGTAKRDLSADVLVERGMEAESKIKHYLETYHITSTGKKTALICVNDELALQVANFTASYDEMKVYGIDARPAALEMGIVSYSQPIAEMAEAAVDALKRQRTLNKHWHYMDQRFKGELKRATSNPMPS